MLKFNEFSDNFLSDKERLVKLVPFAMPNTVVIDDNSDSCVNRHISYLDSTCIFLTHSIKDDDKRLAIIESMLTDRSKILVLKKLQYSCPIVRDYIINHVERIAILRNISDIKPLIRLISEIGRTKRNVEISHTIRDLEALVKNSSMPSNSPKKEGSSNKTALHDDKTCPSCELNCWSNTYICPHCGHEFKRENFNDNHQIRIGIVQRENYRVVNGMQEMSNTVYVTRFHARSDLEQIVTKQEIDNYRTIINNKVKVAHLKPNLSTLLPGTLVYYATDENEKAHFIHRVSIGMLKELEKLIAAENLPYINARVRGCNSLRLARISDQVTSYIDSNLQRPYPNECTHDEQDPTFKMVKRKLIECDLAAYLISEMLYRRSLTKNVSKAKYKYSTQQKLNEIDKQLDRLIFLIEAIDNGVIRKFVFNREIIGIVGESVSYDTKPNMDSTE